MAIESSLLLVRSMDVIALLAGVFALAFAYRQKHGVVGEGLLKLTQTYFFLATASFLLRKISDSIGEFFFTPDAFLWNFLEDGFFLVGIIFLILCARTGHKFYESMSG